MLLFENKAFRSVSFSGNLRTIVPVFLEFSERMLTFGHVLTRLLRIWQFLGMSDDGTVIE